MNREILGITNTHDIRDNESTKVICDQFADHIGDVTFIELIHGNMSSDQCRKASSVSCVNDQSVCFM